jgi:citrate synthase
MRNTLKPFWRDTPLLAGDMEVLNLLHDAHHLCIERNNASSAAVRHVAQSSGSFLNSMIAGIASLGDLHGPIPATCSFLQKAQFDPETTTRLWLAEGKIPGWGNSFIKDGPDPAFCRVHDYIWNNAPQWGNTADRVTLYLHGRGKRVYPNPSLYTAAVSIILGVPVEMSYWLFLRSRLDGWARLFFEQRP